jgi:aspartate 1-decarboxylase
MEEAEAKQHKPKVVLVDERNRIKDANLVELPGPLKRVG